MTSNLREEIDKILEKITATGWVDVLGYQGGTVHGIDKAKTALTQLLNKYIVEARIFEVTQALRYPNPPHSENYLRGRLKELKSKEDRK